MALRNSNFYFFFSEAQLKGSNAKSSDLGNGEVKVKAGPVSSGNVELIIVILFEINYLNRSVSPSRIYRLDDA